MTVWFMSKGMVTFCSIVVLSYSSPSVTGSVMLWLILYLGPSKFLKLGSDLESWNICTLNFQQINDDYSHGLLLP
ncbi:hypothetical protein RchiOBHm_Chr4g0409541 [Rosa chinensis]|uniref:Uncharacterized protein n=1 Tax=Rosa chinensis TaxID=74649 RepID=A0A2P6QV46_ROSCH|nr:hypothetical protein RchiOBHm_Chr4g0409541 [Rosa chinensis]